MTKNKIMGNNDEHLNVTVNEGKLTGTTGMDHNGRVFRIFRGIPYAQPPLGKLRFKAPQPPKKWTGVRDATVEGADCISLSEVLYRIQGSEDCLYLNVYTPELPSGKCHSNLKPVMVLIHGGGFVDSSGSRCLYGPEYLIAEDIVLVTFNYRTGVLGFIYFNDPSLRVPGNAGLKDQVMALKWINNNIQQFGGDPKNITICGISSGGISVECHMLSPMSKGLFHKAIIQSGSSLNAWGRCKYSVMALAEALGIESINEKEILEQLQEVPILKLYRKSLKLSDHYIVGEARPYGLVVEKPSNEPAFLSEEPINILKSGGYTSVPLIMGHTSLEGLYFYPMIASRPKYVLDPSTLIPHTWNLRKGTPTYIMVHNRIKEFYGFNQELERINKDDIYRVYSHNFVCIDMYKSALHHLDNGRPVYFYLFDVDTELNMVKLSSQIESKGAAHADDIPHLFKPEWIPAAEKGSTEDFAVRKMTKLWTNFAKYTNPTPTNDSFFGNVIWKPAIKSQFNYLHIGTTDLKLKKDPWGKELEFWNDLYRTKDVLSSKI